MPGCSPNCVAMLMAGVERGAVPERVRYRLAALLSHPIQYQAPLLRLLAQDPAIDLTVFFCARVGAEAWIDPGFGVSVQWDTPVLDGYRHVFLRNLAPRPSVDRFFGLINPGVMRALGRERWDALLVHGYAHLTNWLAFAACRLRRIPVLLRGESTPHRPTVPLRRAVRSAVLRRLCAGTAACLTIGTLNAEFYRSLGVPAGKLFHTPYAVDNERFVAAAEALRLRRDEIRRRLGIPFERVLLLFSGKLIPRKRPLDLLRAIARPGLEGAVAGFVGDGELRPVLEAEARRLGGDRVRFFGFKNQQELAGYYAAADVFVLPSQFETWGLVVNEAMCFGLPVVTTTAVGAWRDLVREGWNGSVVPPGDVDALSAALARLVGDAGARAEMGRRSRERIATWSHQAAVEGIKAALRAVAGAPRPARGASSASCAS